MFEGWDNYFLMIGSAGGGLIGLLFVVVTLTSGTDRSRVALGQQLYMTPTALAFAAVLTISATALAPRLPDWAIAACVGAIALAGLFSGVRATLGIARMRVGAEPPHWSDFWMYGVTPAALYLVQGAVAAAIAAQWPGAAHGVAAVQLALLLVGIRNAWDLITWIAPRRPSQPT